MTERPSHRQTLTNWAYANVVLPLTEPGSYRGLTSKMKALESRERMSLRENQDIQLQDLLKLLKHAQATSPFYRRRFAEAGLDTARMQSFDDLRKIPPLTREDLRVHLREIQSSQFREEDLQSAATGGTTDTPVPILRSSESVAWKSAVQWRFNAWAGMHPGDKIFYLWGARQDYSENPSWRWRLYDRRLMRRVWAPTSLLNDGVFEAHIGKWNELKPDIVYAYPTPLSLLLEFVREKKCPLFKPRAVICTAEPLSAEQRILMQDVLQCPVFEHYGSREFGMVAAECEAHSGLHFNPMSAFVEFEPISSSDEPGLHEVFVTDLVNYGMPLIRYRANDCVLLGSESCNCGRGFPHAKRIIGRTGDVFILPNGDRVPGVSLTNRVLKVCPGLTKMQIIQDSVDHFCIRYVAGPNFSPADLDALLLNLKRFLPAEIHWNFDQVDVIPRERSGKTRFCISKVATNHPSSNHASS